MMPEFLIVEIGDELADFIRLLKRPYLPTIDVDAALSQLVDVVCTLEDVDDRLASAAYFMGAGEGLFAFDSKEPIEGDEVPFMDQANEKFIHAIVQLGVVIKNNLTQLNAYRNGISPFTYRSLVNESTVLMANKSADDSAFRASPYSGLSLRW